MVTEENLSGLSPRGRQAILLYEERLKPLVEPQHNGEAIAIDPDSGLYEIGRSHGEAARALERKSVPYHQIVTLTIGPPTVSDIMLASRIAAGDKS